MTVTVTSLGTHTKMFTTTDEQGMSGTISAIDTWLTTATQPGWTLYDTVTSGSGGMVTKVYRVLNKDGVTYKYLIVRYELWGWKIYTSTCESWNNTTHVPTNEAWSFGMTMPVGAAPHNCDIVVFASPRYAIFQSFINNKQGIWSGVVEIEREAAEDTSGAGYPCWVWVNSQTLMQSYTSTSAAADYEFLASFPRTRSGAVGAAAAQKVGFVSGVLNPTVIDFAQNVATTSLTHAWDTSKKLIHSPRLVHDYLGMSPANYGRMFGVKAIQPIGGLMNKTVLKVDADKFYDPNGSDADHWVLPLTGNDASSATGVSSSGGGFTSELMATISNTNRCASNGKSLYIAHSAGLKKVDIASLSATDVSTVGSFVDVCFDGVRYMYAARASHADIYRIDTLNNDSITILTTASPAGNRALYVHGNWLWAAGPASTSPTVLKISTSTFTVTSTITLTPTLSINTQAVSFATDFEGAVFVTTDAYGGSSRVYKIVESTDSFTSAATVSGGSTGARTTGVFYDYVLGKGVYYQDVYVSTTTYFYVSELSPSSLAITAIAQPGITYGASAAPSRRDVTNINGLYLSPNPGRATVTDAATKTFFHPDGGFNLGNGTNVINAGLVASNTALISDGNSVYVCTGSAVYRLSNSYNQLVRGVFTSNAQVLLPV